MSLLPLALAVATGSVPAAAQSGSEAVVCVGSETRTLATNPIRRVYTEDMEVVYRTGVDIGQRAQIERTLSSELGSYPEVWCAWPEPGDDHAVIISYTGVIRQDLTVDPEDPRFQAFSVGFGTDFDAAESQATTINQRFSSRNDGSGYEVLLRETWGVAEGVVAAVSAPEPNLPEGRICTEVYSPDSCWMEPADRPGCYLWNPNPRENVTVTWSGECSNGLAQGNGGVNWYQNDELIQIWETRLQDGHRDGPFVQRYGDGALEAEGQHVNGEKYGTWTIFSQDGRDRQGGPYVNGKREGTWTFYWGEGEVGREVGPYVNDERHGTWTGYDQSGNRLGTIRYENGTRVSGFGADEVRVRRARGPTTVRNVRAAVRGGGERSDVRTMGRMRASRWLWRYDSGQRGMGSRHPSGNQRELGGCPRIRGLVIRGDRCAIPTAQRSRVGIRGPCRD